MIAVDASALMAIVLDEPEANACIAALATEDDLVISASTVAEALIVAARRNTRDEMARLIDGLGFEIVSVTPVPKEHACPLLFIGGAFSRTDIASALSR
jgi:ribonuclease VapC